MHRTEPFCREAGTGPGVVCIHANASTSGQWRGLMERLAPRYHVFAPDTTYSLPIRTALEKALTGTRTGLSNLATSSRLLNPSSSGPARLAHSSVIPTAPQSRSLRRWHIPGVYPPWSCTNRLCLR
jgi:hypothetical protein